MGYDLLMTHLFRLSCRIVSWTGDHDGWGVGWKTWSREVIDALGLGGGGVDLGLGVGERVH